MPTRTYRRVMSTLARRVDASADGASPDVSRVVGRVVGRVVDRSSPGRPPGEGGGQSRWIERPQRGQCARTQRASCWPQLQLEARLRLARVLDGRASVVDLLSVRVTSLISQGSRTPRKPTSGPTMTQKLRVWPERVMRLGPKGRQAVRTGVASGTCGGDLHAVVVDKSRCRLYET